MRVEVCRPAELGPRQVEEWNSFHLDHMPVVSPFFSYDYVRAVGEVRADVEVGVVEEGGETVGFFPFQRGWGNIGWPVGLRLCDLEGIVARSGQILDPVETVRRCRLRSFYFRHFLAAPTAFEASSVSSPYLDLERGFEAFRREGRSSGSGLVSQVLRKARKMSREVGELRLEWHTEADDVFETLRRWKSEQRRRTGTRDMLASPWVVELLQRVRRLSGEGVQGVLSALYANGELAAIHLGMRSRDVLHVWFPAYNPAQGKYSPGLILLLELARQGSERGIRRIDFGPGQERYKLSLMTGALGLAAGSFDTTPSTRLLGGFLRRSRRWTLSSWLISGFKTSRRFGRRFQASSGRWTFP